MSKETEKGFSLIELLIVIALGTIVLGIMVTTFVLYNRSYQRETKIVEIQGNARASMELITRELLMAGLNPTGAVGPGVVIADSNKIQYAMDITGDGDIADANETITYEFDQTKEELMRNGLTMADGIRAFSISYYDSSGTQLSPLPVAAGNTRNIKKISLNMTIASAEGTIQSYSVDVVPRNMPPNSTPSTSGTTTTPSSSTTSSVASTAPATSTTTVASSTTSTVVSSTSTSTTTSTTVYSGTPGPTILNVTQDPAGSSVPKNTGIYICADIIDVDGVGITAIRTMNHGDVGMALTAGDQFAGTYCGTIPKHNSQTVTYWIYAEDSYDNSSHTGQYTYTQK